MAPRNVTADSPHDLEILRTMELGLELVIENLFPAQEQMAAYQEGKEGWSVLQPQYHQEVDRSVQYHLPVV